MTVSKRIAGRDRLVIGGMGLLSLYVLVVNAWVVDDAYITFRTVDNFLHGFGLRWNVDERVQAYTHPLWMLVMTAATAITSDVFYTSIAVSIAFSLAAMGLSASLVTRRFSQDHWKVPLLVAALLASRDRRRHDIRPRNAPSYLRRRLLRRAVRGRRTPRLTICGFFASLSFVNRPDLIVRTRRRSGTSWSIARAIRRRAGSAPAPSPSGGRVDAFSLLLRLPLPNTAYAKSLSTSYPLIWRVERGVAYTGNSVQWDTFSFLAVASACDMALRRRSAAERALLAGVCLYILLIVLGLASATHMSGRFFAVPFFVAIVAWVRMIESRRAARYVTIGLVGYLLLNPLSPLKFGTRLYHPYAFQDASYIDTKWFVAQEGSALLNWRPGLRLPAHQWYYYGVQVRDSPDKVHVGGALKGDAIGYFGFAAGPRKFIVDRVGLSDPLLARLLAIPPASYEEWKSDTPSRHSATCRRSSRTRTSSRILSSGAHDGSNIT